MNIVKTLLYYTIEKPIALVYLRGPALNGYGFWEGLPKTDICSRVTNVDARHWAQNEIMCDEIIDNKLHAIYTAVYFVLYVYAVVRVTCVIFEAVSRKIKRIAN